MNVTGVLMIVVLIVVVYFLVRYLTGKSHTLSSVGPATTMQTIQANSLVKGSVANSTNFTYSIWFYVDDWNYKYGEPKIIFGRMGSSSGTPTMSESALDNLDPCPIVTLGRIENNLTISLAVYSGENQSSDPSGNSMVHKCGVSNVPIQKWCNLLISTYGRTMDVYLDGKLVKTCVLPGVPKINQNANVYLTPSGGFAGYTSKFQYFPNSTDPQTAWNIYKAGYGGNMFGSYKVQLVFSNNGSETSSFTL
jgi:Concanavalin A-like lectin/glucanases superfamily